VTHWVPPVVSLKVPMAQFVQELAPAAEYLPTAHAEQPLVAVGAEGLAWDQNQFAWSPGAVLRMTEPPLEIDTRRPAGPPPFQDSSTMMLAPAFKDTVVEAGVGHEDTLETSLPPFTVRMATSSQAYETVTEAAAFSVTVVKKYVCALELAGASLAAPAVLQIQFAAVSKLVVAAVPFQGPWLVVAALNTPFPVAGALTVAPPAENCPAAQLEQELWPVPFWKVPAAQVVQLVAVPAE